MDPCACTGLLLFLCCLASPLHKPIRQLLKPSLVRVTIKQLPAVAAAQAYVSRLIDIAVLLSAATITLEVYLTLIPLLIWSGWDSEVSLGLLPQLALSGYVVFAIKDLLESPRPGDCLKAAPEVEIIVRDPSGDIEDGVPSAHCCGAVSLLYYGIHSAAAAGLLSDQQRLLAQAAAAVWVVWLAWGRAYLGLHSPLDLATGTLLGWVLLRSWVAIEQPYTAWLQAAVQQGPWQLPLQVLLASFILMRCYPLPSRWTSCYNYATAWQAGWAGVTVGWGVLQQTQWVTAANSSSWLLGGVVPPLACKVFLGLGMVAASKVLGKAILLAAFKPTFRFVPLTVRCLWQPPVVGAVKQVPLQQKQSVQVSGYAASAAGKGSSEQHAAGAAGVAAAVLPAQASGQVSTKAAGKSSSSAGLWVAGLRHTSEGVGNDVVAAARWGSYFAVGLTVSLWQAAWPLVLQWLAPSVSVS